MKKYSRSTENQPHISQNCLKKDVVLSSGVYFLMICLEIGRFSVKTFKDTLCCFFKKDIKTV